MSQRYVLNENPDALDVVHVNPGGECNTDDAEGRKNVDELTARSLVGEGIARWCEHCGISDPT